MQLHPFLALTTFLLATLSHTGTTPTVPIPKEYPTAWAAIGVAIDSGLTALRHAPPEDILIIRLGDSYFAALRLRDTPTRPYSRAPQAQFCSFESWHLSKSVTICQSSTLVGIEETAGMGQMDVEGVSVVPVRGF
ncbi:MAG: hypothetical protein M1829_002685 [Trizodia sp. TS-e1964]|nr:MAG: hypothetical protein M1829_002685 [Trizodia sp. TS-e1964]